MDLDSTLGRRLVGVATGAYGAAVALRPATLLGPACLADTTTNRRLSLAVGVRDVLSGVALVVTAAQTRNATWAVRARVAADLSDVVVFGILCPQEAKFKAMAVAGGYGALCATTHPRRR